MAAEVLQGRSMEEARHESAMTMEGFIKHQMMVILQPFIDQVEALDQGLDNLTGHLGQTDSHIGEIKSEQKATQAMLEDLRDGVIERTNGRIKRLQEGMERCVQNHEVLHEGHEETRGHVRQLQNQVSAMSGAQPDMHLSVQQLIEDLEAQQAALNRTATDLEENVKHHLSQLGLDLQDLKTREGKVTTDIEQLQAGLAETTEQLYSTREVLEKSTQGSSGLRREVQEIIQREAQMGARVEGWKHQWSKINPALDALRKETGVLKQRVDHHDTVVHGLQQGFATTFSGIEAVEGKHSKLVDSIGMLKENFSSVQGELQDVRDGLGKTTSFSNNLHTVVERTMGELGRAAKKIDGLESRHDLLTEHMEKTTGDVAELAREHKTSAAEVQLLQQDLRKLNDHLHSTKSQLEVTSSGLQGMQTELGRTNEAVQRLDHGVELCHAGFSGLQRGFQETGNHMSSRPITLPKLPLGERSLRSPRHPDLVSPSSLTTTAGSWKGS